MATPAETRLKVASPAPSNVVVVAEALREALIEGRFRPGERIKEIPVARQLGTSRGPIRDALRLLENDGLVEIVPNRGAFVATVRARDILEVYALRTSIGSLALHKLMLDPNPSVDARLTRALSALETAVERGSERQAVRADLAFQSAIVEGAALERVSKEFDRLSWQVRQFIATLDVHYEDKLGLMLQETQSLHRAMVDRDGKRAEALWREKFERWVRDFIAGMPDEDFDAELWLVLTAGPGRKP